MAKTAASLLALWFVSLLLTVSARSQPPAGGGAVALAGQSSRSVDLRSITGRTVTFDFSTQGGSMAALGTQQLSLIRSSSGYTGELPALAALLDADDDLVSVYPGTKTDYKYWLPLRQQIRLGIAHHSGFAPVSPRPSQRHQATPNSCVAGMSSNKWARKCFRTLHAFLR